MSKRPFILVTYFHNLLTIIINVDGYYIFDVIAFWEL